METLHANDGQSRHLVPFFLPPVAVLEMTYKCNHKCLFCSCPWYAPGTGPARLRKKFKTHKELSVEQWKEVIDKCCASGVTNIAFTGGEPLLKKGIFEIIEYAASRTVHQPETDTGKLEIKTMSPSLFLLSNGLAMTTDVLELCKRLNINLSMSLPGLETFRRHTGRDNAASVLSWFEKARQMGVSTTVGITVTALNISRLYENIAAAFVAGADNLLMNRFLPGGRGLKYRDQLELSIDQVRQMLDTAEEVLQVADRNGSVGTELPKCLVDLEPYKRLQVATRCSAGVEFFVVGPSGYLRVCNHSPVRLNHVDQLEEVKGHPYWKQFVLKDYLPAGCSGCRQATTCDGGCREAAHIVGGTLDAPDPAMADFTSPFNSCSSEE
ncbi:MAG: radical SAM protein [bacterium]|nr:radical SAM protein [bacterium]